MLLHYSQSHCFVALHGLISSNNRRRNLSQLHVNFRNHHVVVLLWILYIKTGNVFVVMDVGGVAGSTRSKLDRTTKLLTLNRLRRRSAASGGRRFRQCLCVSVPEASCQTARRGYYEDPPLDRRKKKDTREREKNYFWGSVCAHV